MTLKKLGKIVYLKHKFATIEKRLGDLKKRGVVLKEGFTLQDLYEERAPLYEKYADETVCLDGLSVERAAQKIAEIIKRG